MTTLNFTDDQMLVLKAAWEYFLESDDHVEAMTEALELSEEEDDTSTVEERINEVTKIIFPTPFK